mmetsp:Transcript_10274/g.23151  ORF Transcript_10274/g.23151 Transcript_10274/m.23151 type:complete len:221 (+) Transcript_10274:70-732(+)
MAASHGVPPARETGPAMMSNLPPPPFIPAMDRRDHAGGGRSTIMGGTFRRPLMAAAADVPPPPLHGLHERIGQRTLYQRAGSEGRLQTATSHRGSTARSMRSSISGRSSSSRGSRGGVDGMWEALGPLSRRDHVSCLLQQPLLEHGHDPALKRTSVNGPLPRCPAHLAVVQSECHGTHRYNKEFRDVCVGQQASELWRGFGRDFQSEYNEAKIMMGHIMR